MMATVYQLERKILVPAPLDVVFEFFSDATNLERLTPDFLRFRISTPTPIHMAEGIFIDYRLRVRGIPMKWRSRIAVWEPPHRFVDEQVKGPYRSWYHEHLFEAGDGGTWVRDHVRYQVPGWFLGPLIHRYMICPDVEQIFDYRTTVLSDLFSG